MKYFIEWIVFLNQNLIEKFLFPWKQHEADVIDIAYWGWNLQRNSENPAAQLLVVFKSFAYQVEPYTGWSR